MDAGPPYTVTCADRYGQADCEAGAFDAADDMYDPSGPILDVLDCMGNMAFDPVVVVAAIIERRQIRGR